MDGAAETCDQVSFFPFCLGDEGKKNAFSLFSLSRPTVQLTLEHIHVTFKGKAK